MAYRIVSIENPAEVHVKNGQLVVEQDKGVASIPLKDITTVVVCGLNIRISTMAQGILAQHKIVMLFLGRNHHPEAMLLPEVGYARQARVMQSQASISSELRDELWRQVIVQKIENQARALAILGLEGAETLWACAQNVLPGDATNREGFAAQQYFQFLQPGLNRRVDDPLNSVLNYGYAIVRAVMAREVVCAGLIPALGLHHRSQLNPFNLVDDLMEPFRPCIDLLAAGVAGKSVRLSPRQRAELRKAPRLSVLVDGVQRSSPEERPTNRKSFSRRVPVRTPSTEERPANRKSFSRYGFLSPAHVARLLAAPTLGAAVGSGLCIGPQVVRLEPLALCVHKQSD